MKPSDTPITRQRFMQLMEDSYRQRAKVQGWRPSELAMTLATCDTRLKPLWNKVRKAQLTEAEVVDLIQGGAR